jgi:hypothetical protein
MNACPSWIRVMLLLAVLCLSSGCCATRGNRGASDLAPLTGTQQTYAVELEPGNTIRSRSVRFEGDWVILVPADGRAKELWIRRNRVASIDVPE